MSNLRVNDNLVLAPVQSENNMMTESEVSVTEFTEEEKCRKQSNFQMVGVDYVAGS